MNTEGYKVKGESPAFLIPGQSILSLAADMIGSRWCLPPETYMLIQLYVYTSWFAVCYRHEFELYIYYNVSKPYVLSLLYFQMDIAPLFNDCVGVFGVDTLCVT